MAFEDNRNRASCTAAFTDVSTHLSETYIGTRTIWRGLDEMGIKPRQGREAITRRLLDQLIKANDADPKRVWRSLFFVTPNSTSLSTSIQKRHKTERESVAKILLKLFPTGQQKPINEIKTRRTNR